ncbi:MAG: MFS transporter [Deltaproteobacteria bacterium]|nr:MFS transporter [Deltaproteobacteria bacterium]MBW2382498.1 MFS transporter [Deltaproteobacteria bacterium]
MTANQSDDAHLSEDDRHERILADEGHNLVTLAVSTILVRVGWIFKVESVIMPAFLDSIAGAGWLRGLLPVMNRLGQSLPSFLLSRRLKLTPRKRSILLASAFGMSVPFGILAALLFWLGPGPPGWFAALFLILYGFFFASTGLNALALGTLQGKLVRAHRRGRLLAVATMGGALPAIGFAVWLLPGWLELGAAGWPLIFSFTCVSFALSAGVALAIREPPDDYQEARAGVVEQLAGGWRILRTDHEYRRLVIVGVLFTTMLMLIPHYQALGRVRLGLGGADMMVWVIAQTAAGGIASVLIGPIADKYGNRFSFRLVAAGSALVPCLAVAIAGLSRELGGELYPLVFLGLGMTPVGFRLLSNYILELAPESDHPRYLSLFQLCAAVMVLWSPLLGWLIDRIGYTPVFLAVSGAIAAAALLTFGLVEPRRRTRGG